MTKREATFNGKPDTETGFWFKFSKEFLFALCQAPLSGREFRVILAVVFDTWAAPGRLKSAPISLKRISELTSIDKANCGKIARKLISLRILKRSGPKQKTAQLSILKYYFKWLVFDRKEIEHRAKKMSPEGVSSTTTAGVSSATTGGVLHDHRKVSSVTTGGVPGDPGSVSSTTTQVTHIEIESTYREVEGRRESQKTDPSTSASGGLRSVVNDRTAGDEHAEKIARGNLVFGTLFDRLQAHLHRRLAITSLTPRAQDRIHVLLAFGDSPEKLDGWFTDAIDRYDQGERVGNTRWPQHQLLNLVEDTRRKALGLDQAAQESADEDDEFANLPDITHRPTHDYEEDSHG